MFRNFRVFEILGHLPYTGATQIIISNECPQHRATLAGTIVATFVTKITAEPHGSYQTDVISLP